MFLACADWLPADLLRASSVRDLAPQNTLYHQGDRAQAVYVVLHGRLQLFSCTAEGKKVALYVVRCGECVSEAALFAELYCSDVVAEVRSRVRAFPKEALQKTLCAHPKLAKEFMALQAQQFNRIRLTLELRALRSARERILQYLRMLSPPGSRAVRLDRPLKSMAEDLNLSHETFYRTLAQLIEEGSILRTKSSLSLPELHGPGNMLLPPI